MTESSGQARSERGWRVFFTPRMLVCIITGFSAGLPLYLLFNLLPAWLETEGLSLKTIGAFALVQMPYTWKFVWAPLLDNYSLLPRFGRRKSWMLVSQLGLLAAIAWLGQLSPAQDLQLVVVGTVVLAFLSATQDIAIDALRREILADEELGLGNSLYVNAYRLASLVPASLSLILADHLPWPAVFMITALFMLPGIAVSLWIREPQVERQAARSLEELVVAPFREFFDRLGLRSALLVLAFMLLYKIGDSLASALATPFYLQMGYTMTEIGVIVKQVSLWSMIAGGLVGGVWMLKLGINRALWIFGVAQAVTTLGFAWMAWHGTVGPDDAMRHLRIAVVIFGEAFGAGLGTAAFVAFMARTTNPLHTATQLALFTSLMAVPRTFVNASSGFLVEALGWTSFFVGCFVLAIPGMILLLWVAPWQQDGTPAAPRSAEENAP